MCSRNLKNCYPADTFFFGKELEKIGEISKYETSFTSLTLDLSDERHQDHPR